MDSNFVLVADDDPACREVLETTLRFLGFAAMSAADGVQAFEIATSKRPRLIFMDLNMPRMDGLEAARAIHQSPNTANIPIVAMSANCNGHKWRAFQSSCVHWLRKPWVLDDLCEVLSRLCLETPCRATRVKS
jgi:CheY-like chemotaxis protein